VQIGAVDGYDPMLGIMHYEREGSPAFVFDLMEPERPKVDRAVLAFLESAGLHPGGFTIREDEVVSWRRRVARWGANEPSDIRIRLSAQSHRRHST
jgi:CRISP-associated protein Cas1